MNFNSITIIVAKVFGNQYITSCFNYWINIIKGYFGYLFETKNHRFSHHMYNFILVNLINLVSPCLNYLNLRFINLEHLQLSIYHLTRLKCQIIAVCY